MSSVVRAEPSVNDYRKPLSSRLNLCAVSVTQPHGRAVSYFTDAGDGHGLVRAEVGEWQAVLGADACGHE